MFVGLAACHWADCGGGSCRKTSALTYDCDCKTGYFNLLNVTIFPCLRECALGMDCTNLDIGRSTNKSASTPAPSLSDHTNKGEIFFFLPAFLKLKHICFLVHVKRTLFHAISVILMIESS
nr:adhesive plaque matrix protein 2-like isoform X2 [Ipomoea batatas]